MGKILFIVIPEKGHINPCIGVASHLQEMGYRVAFFAGFDISPQLARAGFKEFLGPTSEGPPLDMNRGKVFADHVRDPQWLRSWIKDLLIDQVPLQVEPLRRVVKEFAPDLIVADPMVYQAAIVAETENIPWVALSNSLNPVLDERIDSDLLRTVRWLSDDRDRLFKRFGLNMSFKGCDMLSPYLTIAFTTPEFIGREVEGVEMVGPSMPAAQRGDEPEFDWEQMASDVPVIYMSFGSQVYYQPELFRKVMAAVKNRPVQLVMSVNELRNSAELGEIPSNCIAAYAVPQLELLKRARAMITHGGANSVMEAIHAGVPLLISPLCNDQFHQVWFVEKSGIGKGLDLNDATPDHIWNILNEMCLPGRIRTRLARVSRSYQVDGARRAAMLISEEMK